MFKRKLGSLFIGFILISGFNLYANAIVKSEVYGKVIHSQTKKPMQDVSVVILQKNKIITGTLTNKKGVFKIENLDIGNYIVKISFMGFKTFQKSITIKVKNDKIKLKLIELESELNELNAVEIRAEKTRITQEVDKQVIHVGSDLLATGSTAIEILSSIPSITVDGNNKVSFRGSQNVIIYVDGRPTNMNAEDVLNQIPANTINKIELISNPSARYNPEGLSGIINIILIKNSNLGFHGVLNSGVTVGKKLSNNSSLNMNFKKGKINLFTNLGYVVKNRKNNGYFHHLYNGVFDDFIVENQKKSKLLKLGFDFDISDKQTFSFYTYQNGLKTDKDKNSVTVTNTNTNAIFTENKFDNKVQIYNLNYIYDFAKKGKKLEMEFNFDTNKINQKNTEKNITDNITSYVDNIDIKRNYTIFNIDFQNVYAKDYKIELGAESRLRKTDNNMQTTQINLNPTSFFEYDRSENSVYFTLNKKINDKFSYKIGSRLESYAYQVRLDNAEIYKNNYLTIYPSFYVVYKKNKKHRFQLGYSKHIFRPDINQVNPTRLWSSAVMTFVGNPRLKPTFVDYIELIYTYRFKNGALRLNPFYQVNTNTIYQSLSPDPNDPNRLILSYDNGTYRYLKELEMSFYYKINNWWSVSLANYALISSDQGIVNGVLKKINYNTINTTLYQSFTINSKFKITVLGKYNSAAETLQVNTVPYGKVDIGGRYRILKNKASITLKFNDVLNTSKYSFYAKPPYEQKGFIQLDSRSIYFGFSYDFGSKKIKNRQRKTHKNQEIDGDGIF